MSEVKEFKLVRDTYRNLTTVGKLYLPDGRVFETLEDCVRASGIKDKGNTAIPDTEALQPYKLGISFSQRFQRDMPIIHTGDGISLSAQGIQFKGIRMHGGNTDADTEGCILVAKQRVSDTRIYGTMEKEVTALLKAYQSEGIECVLHIINQPQSA